MKETEMRERLGTIKAIPTYQASVDDFSKPHEFLRAKFKEMIGREGAIKILPPQGWNPPFYYDQCTTRLHTKVVRFKAYLDGRESTEFNEKGPYFYDLLKMDKHFKARVAARKLAPAGEEGFWRLVESKENIQDEHSLRVEYASDLPHSRFERWRPKEWHNPFREMEVANVNRVKGEMFSFLEEESHISGLSESWVYVGMAYTPFCWHSEDLYLSALNYSHMGETKTWYFIPPSDAEKYEAYFRQRFAEQLKEHPNLLYDLVTIIPPYELVAQGISVHRVEQEAGQFVYVCGKTYHAGFSHGFNCGEAVNVAQTEWFPLYRQAMSDYARNSPSKKGVFPLEWLVMENMQKVEQFELDEVEALYAQFLHVVRDYLGELKVHWKDMRRKNKGKLKADSMRYYEQVCGECHEYSYMIFWYCWECQAIGCLTHELKCHKNVVVIFRYNHDDLKRLFSRVRERLGAERVLPDVQQIRGIIHELK